MFNNHTNWSIIGGVAAAIGASLCCAGPLILLSIGVSGAWIANLTVLEPYRPYFIVAVVALFSWAGWQVYKPISQCKPGTACALPATRKKRQLIFILALIVAVGFVSSPYWIPLFA